MTPKEFRDNVSANARRFGTIPPDGTGFNEYLHKLNTGMKARIQHLTASGRKDEHNAAAITSAIATLGVPSDAAELFTGLVLRAYETGKWYEEIYTEAAILKCIPAIIPYIRLGFNANLAAQIFNRGVSPERVFAYLRSERYFPEGIRTPDALHAFLTSEEERKPVEVPEPVPVPEREPLRPLQLKKKKR
jgi:hypothetical protein